MPLFPLLQSNREFCGTAREGSLLLAMLAAAGCQPYPEGIRSTPGGEGPVVVIDWEAEPLPELPFPNNLATRPDPASPTGLRLNISTYAHTAYESETREKRNELTGFGIFSPISVRFDAPLDLDHIERQGSQGRPMHGGLFLRRVSKRGCLPAGRGALGRGCPGG